jgi:O-antigen biosynthesis protein
LNLVDGKVSVVLPVYFVNRVWLSQSISSVLDQDYKNLELIVVNDLATEDIDDLVESFGIVKYVKNSKNMKLPYSLNRGFELADGEYHTWTSADNYMLPGMISRLVKELEKYPDYAIVRGKSESIDEHDQPMATAKSANFAEVELGCDLQGSNIERAFTYFSTLGSCFLYRKEVWEDLDGYDEERHGSEDFDFWIRASRKFRIRRLPIKEKPYYRYRAHLNSISSKENDCYTEARLSVLRREAALYPKDVELIKAIGYYQNLVKKRKRTNLLKHFRSSIGRFYTRRST